MAVNLSWGTSGTLQLACWEKNLNILFSQEVFCLYAKVWNHAAGLSWRCGTSLLVLMEQLWKLILEIMHCIPTNDHLYPCVKLVLSWMFELLKMSPFLTFSHSDSLAHSWEQLHRSVCLLPSYWYLFWYRWGSQLQHRSVVQLRHWVSTELFFFSVCSPSSFFLARILSKIKGKL